MISFGRSALPFALVVVLQTGAAAAQNPPAPPPEASFQDEVTVTAGRTEQAIKDVPATVFVVTRRDIAQSSARTVDELLRRIPGFNLLREGSSIGGHPTVRSVSLRGLGGSSNSRTLVLVDGIPVNEPFSGTVYWTRIPLESIERIEVVTGGTSVLWGNFALAGVIHIITAKPQPKTLEVTAEYGARDTGKLRVGASGVKGALRGGVSASYFETGGYPVIRADQRGAVDRSITDTYHTLDGSVSYQQSERAEWTVGGSFYSENQGYGTVLGVDDVKTGYIRAGGDFASGGNRWRVNGFLTRQNATTLLTTVAQGRNSETPASDQFDTPSSRNGVSVQWSRPVWERHLLTAGTDMQWVSATANEDTTFTAGRFTRRRVAGGNQMFDGAYVEDVFIPSSPWRIVGAVRVDRWKTGDGSRRELDLVSGATLLTDNHPDQKTWAVSPSLGVRRSLTSRVALKGSIYRAFRAPTPSELYRPFRSRGNTITESNPLLVPERLTGAEGGIEADAAPGLHTRVVTFWNRLEDPVVTTTIADAGPGGRTIVPCGFVPAGGVCRQRQNLGQIRSRGVEADAEYQHTGGWALNLGYHYAGSRVTDAPQQPQLVGKVNRQTPDHQVIVGGTYGHPRGLSVSMQARYVSERFDDDLNRLPIAGFAVADFRVAHDVGSKAEIYFSVQNLFDRTYEVTRSEDGTVSIGPPRLANLGIHWRF